jgi:hypothetical protein
LEAVDHGCQIFLGTWYQNRKNVPNGHKNSPNGHKTYLTIKGPQNFFSSHTSAQTFHVPKR